MTDLNFGPTEVLRQAIDETYGLYLPHTKDGLCRFVNALRSGTGTMNNFCKVSLLVRSNELHEVTWSSATAELAHVGGLLQIY